MERATAAAAAAAAAREWAPTGPRPDVHELLKRGLPPGPEGGRPSAAKPHGVSDHYLVLDSWRKEPASDLGRGEFRFALMVGGSTGDRVLGVRDPVSTVIEVQLGPFPLPPLPEVPYVLRAAPPAPTGRDTLAFYHNNTNGGAGAPRLAAAQYPAIGPAAAPPYAPWPFNPYSQLADSGRFTVQLREAGLQGFCGPDGARHQFEFFHVAAAGLGALPPGVLLARPAKGGWDTFTFTDPLRDLHELTLVFRGPDVPLRFDPDVLYDAQVFLDASAAPGPFVGVRAAGHGLLAGDRVFLRGARTGLAGLDAYLGRAEGHVAAGDPAAPLAPGTPIALADPDIFYLDPAVSGADFTSPLSLPAACEVFVAKRRLRIPMRCRGVVDRVTNYLTP